MCVNIKGAIGTLVIDSWLLNLIPSLSYTDALGWLGVSVCTTPSATIVFTYDWCSKNLSVFEDLQRNLKYNGLRSLNTNNQLLSFLSNKWLVFRKYTPAVSIFIWGWWCLDGTNCTPTQCITHLTTWEWHSTVGGWRTANNSWTQLV